MLQRVTMGVEVRPGSPILGSLGLNKGTIRTERPEEDAQISDEELCAMMLERTQKGPHTYKGRKH